MIHIIIKLVIGIVLTLLGWSPHIFKSIQPKTRVQRIAILLCLIIGSALIGATLRDLSNYF
jgi:small-conductance mechanosensitive channel